MWSWLKDSRVFCYRVTITDFQFLLKFLCVYTLILFSSNQMFEALEGNISLYYKAVLEFSLWQFMFIILSLIS